MLLNFANRNIIKRFLNSGDKDNFSGYALYLHHGIPVQLSKYKNGVKRRGASIIGINDKDLRIRNIKLITQELSAFKFQFHMATPLTRTGGENDGFYGCPNCQSMPCQCLDDVDVECCSICGSTGGCMCYIYDLVCPFCNSYPCSCKQSLSCPECGSQGCNGECQTSNGCDYCGNLWCIGDCQHQGCQYCGESDCGGECQETESCSCGCCAKCGYDTGEPSYEECVELGQEVFNKWENDINNNNVTVHKVAIGDLGKGMLIGTGVGTSYMDVVSSAAEFMKTHSTEAFKHSVGSTCWSLFGFGISATQTIIAVTDGDISNADLLSIASTALSSVGVVAMLTPISWPIVAGAGVMSGILGLASTFTTSHNMLMEISLENGSKVYLYLT